MLLNINNEFSTLKSVVVCKGVNAPEWETHQNNDPEFLKYHQQQWNKSLLLKQQDDFFSRLQKYNVNLVFPKTKSNLLHQMYTRDTAFVIGTKLYYSKIRKFTDRRGEIDCLLSVLNLTNDQLVEINHEIEGGDVLISGPNSVYVGTGSRTHNDAVTALSKAKIITKTFDLGDNVMHLDTRMTLLPNNFAIVNTSCLLKNDFEYLNNKYKIIPITDDQAHDLASNVFIVNPETIFVAKQHPFMISKLIELGFNVEVVDYSEPINLRGSFRCTTMPLFRED